MTRLEIITNIDGSQDKNRVIVEDTKTAVTIDEMFELFRRALAGLGFDVEELKLEEVSDGEE